MRWGIVAVVLCARAFAQEPTLHELRAIIDERDQRYNQRFDAQERAVTAALAAAKEAVAKAETASDKRFEGVNEFRNTLKDQQGTFATRIETTSQIKAVLDKLDTLDARVVVTASRVDFIVWAWSGTVTLAGLGVGAASIFWRRRTR